MPVCLRLSLCVSYCVRASLFLSVIAWAGRTNAQPTATAAPPSVVNVKEFAAAAAQGDQEAIDKALDEGLDINVRTPTGLTVWHVAKRRGYVELADYLVTKGADATVPMPEPDALAAAMFGRDVAEDSPALAVLVSRDGDVLFEQTFGGADIEDQRLADIHTKFRIGSVTKQFTAAAILKLQEHDELQVADKLSKYFPDFPRGDEITLHHLLTHTSGIHSYTAEPAFAARVTSPIAVDDLISEIQTYDAEFDVGEKWEYCNSGYLLLGRIIEIVSGQTYATFLKEQFFDSLGMQDSGIYENGTTYVNEAKGYSFVDEVVQPAKPWNMSWAGGAGQLYSTLHDLMKWNEGVFGGEVLSESSLEAAFTPAVLNDGSATQYGYGWMISEVRGLKVITHNGGLDGFATHLSRYPDQNVTFVAMSNCVPVAAAPPDAFRAGGMLAEVYLWQEMQPRKPPEIDQTIDTEKLAKFVGRYDYGGAVMTLTLKDGQFFGQLTGQPAIKLFPKSETVLVSRVVEASIEFVMDDDGKVTHVIHQQGGNKIEAPRMEDVEFTELSAEELEKFVGKYDYGPAGKMTITRKHDQLMAQLTGQPAFRIRPISATAFAWVAVNARIEFQLDDDGNIVSATHFQAGRELPVKPMSE